MDKIKSLDWVVTIKALTALLLAGVLCYMVITNNPHIDNALRVLLMILTINQGAQSVAQHIKRE